MEEKEKIINIAGYRFSYTGLELILGDVIYYLIGQIGILIFSKHILYVSIGFLAGVLISIAMIIHMTIAIEQAMSFNEEGADKHVKKTTAIRLVLCAAVLVILGITDIGNIVATLFGVMALKVSAYMQPFTHKVLAKKSK